MPLSWRDSIATLLVAIGVVIYGAFVMGLAIPGLDSVAAIAIGILALGIAASVSAVVPGFDALLHGSRMYFAGTSVLGLIALGAGIYAIANGDSIALAILALTTVVLWALSIARHVGVRGPQARLGHL
jgi:hypothetical protein